MAINADVNGFFKFINRRHLISIRKDRGDPRPWTKDPILHEGKFTNIYRMRDRVSRYVTREILNRFKPWKRKRAAQLVFEIIAFRLFNWPPTFELLEHLIRGEWDEEEARRILHKRQSRGDKIFTGAWVVTNNGQERPKIDIVCEAVTVARQVAPLLVAGIREERTMRAATHLIEKHVPCCGPFIAYEMACDLRWSPLLDRANDIHEWANAGPGAKKGTHWLLHGDDEWTGTPPDYGHEMWKLLQESTKPGRLRDYMEPLEMRDIEHSLCEWQKYLRVKYKGGRLKSKYTPTPANQGW
jgi:alpha-glutamyl/putrescinyl thymine pyrophosphorylase clade 1